MLSFPCGGSKPAAVEEFAARPPVVSLLFPPGGKPVIIGGCEGGPSYMERSVMQLRIGQLCLIAAVGAGGWLLGGCTSDASMRDRQDAAMKDPFHYSPNMERTDISGGNLGNFNGKAIGKDLDDVINP
jgi:hypothetical protein